MARRLRSAMAKEARMERMEARLAKWRRSPSPPLVAPPPPPRFVASCLRVREMERAYPGGPGVYRDWPDLYGPTKQSLYDWYDHALAGRQCSFEGQCTSWAVLYTITIHGYGATTCYTLDP